MHAALITDFTRPPQYAEFRDPEASDRHEVVEVLAAAVHRVVRSRAAGEHYSAEAALPQIPGVDGIARTAAGLRIYTGGAPTPFGTLAERAPVRRGFAVPVPDALDDVTAAAIVNPASSSWLPLDRLLPTDRPATVLVIGATGVSGALAVQVAHHLGARVIAAARDAGRLATAQRHGADAILTLADLGTGLAAVAPEGVDVVLDYVWGETTEAAIAAIAALPRDPALPIEYVQLGGLGGSTTIRLDAVPLRSRSLRISGSGLGSVPPATMLRVAGSVLAAAAAGALTIDAEPHPLAEVEQAWNTTGRLVLVP